MFIPQKLKKIFFCNHFKRSNIVFLFLMLAISLMILVFFNDFKKATDKDVNYFVLCKYEPPEFVEGGILDYSKHGFFPGHNTLVKMIFYFTYQSNLFVLIIYALFFTKTRQKKWYHYAIFTCLISISMTGLIYHIVIDKFAHFKKFDFKNSYIISHLQHTLIPLTYLYFYFFVNNFAISYKKIWVGWLHALAYMVFFSLFSFFMMQPYWKNLSPGQRIINSQKDAEQRDPFKIFPYTFFSPLSEDQIIPPENLGKKQYCFVYVGYKYVFRLYSLLFVIIALMTYILLWIKKRMLYQTKKLIKFTSKA
ncbi:hypothetical protein [Candidatus Phytoplasma solani]|uniref:Uncharacterized protein n=1 Tax=Candidatus Phytoplasma solani TaxID=69896 RepID=A0A421NYN7_9MOLU|nr:hypothetical protein [Candidatus Phytoplasma solani]RMI89133.1 hypothetical protein PSSA1_v1c0120 [Candidatus Phytoplasma solani]CCP88372.1 conserved hypothetical protein [Candidatus Phytoplasma solani]